MLFNPLVGTHEFTMAQAERISKTWWSPLVIGLITLAAGIMIVSSTWTLSSIAIFFGVLLIVRGFAQLAVAPGFDIDSRTWTFFVGILNIIVGVAIFFFPAPSLLFVALYIGLWLLLTGLFDIAGSLAVVGIFPYWWLILIRGLVAVPLGFWAISRPYQALEVVIYAFGIWAMIVGVLEIAIAIYVRRLPHLVERAFYPQPGTA